MRAYTNPQQIKSQKMLASTVQFSTTNQTPITRPHQPHTPTRGHERYEIQTGPEPEATTPTHQRAGPLPQDPTACLRTRPHTRTPLHTHPSRGMPY